MHAWNMNEVVCERCKDMALTWSLLSRNTTNIIDTTFVWCCHTGWFNEGKYLFVIAHNSVGRIENAKLDEFVQHLFIRDSGRKEVTRWHFLHFKWFPIVLFEKRYWRNSISTYSNIQLDIFCFSFIWMLKQFLTCNFFGYDRQSYWNVSHLKQEARRLALQLILQISFIGVLCSTHPRIIVSLFRTLFVRSLSVSLAHPENKLYAVSFSMMFMPWDSSQNQFLLELYPKNLLSSRCFCRRGCRVKLSIKSHSKWWTQFVCEFVFFLQNTTCKTSKDY